ncbi:Gfo/Idh/MocA family oxidoreductase [Pyruvatibacter sp.]|uniref:Gfo/Idh/MocA family protein n=1 Tax=Pyruvatibacter sp. TaxID=1981328 RepID=UPI0032F09429
MAYTRPKLSRVRTGVIGAGYFGRLHVSKYATVPGSDLAGVYDLNPERAKHVADEFSCAVMSAPEDFFGQVDAVSIVAPATRHFELAKLFLEQGIHVLIEKPIATTLEDADTLIKLARDKRAVIQVGHQERYVFSRFDLPTLVSDPCEIICRRAGPFTGRNVDVSAILDLMIHDIDISHQILRYQPQTVEATGRAVHGDLADEVDAVVTTKDGRTVRVFASRVGDKLERSVRIICDDREIMIDFANRQFELTEKNADGVRRVMDPEEVDGLPVIDELVAQDPLAEEIGGFVNAVATGARPRVSGEDARRALATALAIEAAVGPLTREDRPLTREDRV